MNTKLLFRTIIISLFVLFIIAKAEAQFSDADSFRDGFYYDLQGVKHIGLIKFKANKAVFLGSKTKIISSFIYKINDKAEKQVIDAANVKCAVAMADSFIVRSGFKKEKKGETVIDTTKVFIQVVLNTKGRSVYCLQYGLSGFQNGPAVSFTDTVVYEGYFYGDDLGMVTAITDENFTEIMSEILRDSPDLVKDINAKKHKAWETGGYISAYKKEKGIPMNL